MKKILLIICVITIIFNTYAFADVSIPIFSNTNDIIQVTNQYITDKYGIDSYFPLSSINKNRPINSSFILGSYWGATTNNVSPMYNFVYGSPSDITPNDVKNISGEGIRHRYLGYSKFDNLFPNMYFPDDTPLDTKYDQRTWVKNPWASNLTEWDSSKKLRTICSEGENNFDAITLMANPKYNNPDYLRENIIMGMGICYGLMLDPSSFVKYNFEQLKNMVYDTGHYPSDSKLSGKFLTSVNSDSVPDFENYVHIITPPSMYTWGFGRIWRQVGAGCNYLTIPLAPDALTSHLNNQDYSVTILRSGTEGEAKIDSTGEYEAIIEYSVKDYQDTNIKPAVSVNIQNGIITEMFGNTSSTVQSTTMTLTPSLLSSWNNRPDKKLLTIPAKQASDNFNWFTDSPVVVNRSDSAYRANEHQPYYLPSDDKYFKYSDTIVKRYLYFKWKPTGNNNVNISSTINPDLSDTDSTNNYDEIILKVSPAPSIPISSDGMDSTATAIIKADNRGSEKFDVLKGIPSSENLYVNVFCNNYLYDSKFTESSGSRSFNVTVSKTYNLSWEEDHGHSETTTTINSDGSTSTSSHWVSNWVSMADTQTVSRTYTVGRNYSYWVIDHLGIYEIDNAVVNNYALPSGYKKLTPKDYTPPVIDSWHSAEAGKHITLPTVSNLTLPLQSLSGGRSGKPSIPTEDWSTNADSSVGQISVKNDRVVLNGKVIMTDDNASADTKDPLSIPESPKISNDVLYAHSLNIDDIKLNKVCTSNGTITYKLSPGSITSNTDVISQVIKNINSVTIHTPVVSHADVWDDADYNQEINPVSDRAAVILDRTSKISIPTTGQHRNILGYGNRDYAKYTKDKQVRFPFDVYLNTTYRQDGKYLKANTWASIPVNINSVDYYVPTWVNEGNYNVDFREISINAPDLTKTQDLANLDLNNYVATRSIPVRVIGRMFGFRITDITDSTWNSVFRTSANTTQHSNNYYWVGTNNQNGVSSGINSKFTLPILDGSNPSFKNIGALKTGYKFKFELQTIGNYFNEYDGIDITPQFYYVSNKGSNIQAVDLYYTERFNNKDNYFVKVDSDTSGRNRQNTKYIRLSDVYRNVPDSEIIDTSRILGIDKNVFKNQDTKLGWFDWIFISKGLRTFTGDSTNLPSGVNADSVKKSKQKWYGEYYLPNYLYACPKDTNIAEYGRTHNGIDAKSDLWMKNGYIVVNFKINSIKNQDYSHPVLSYYEAPNCNMWQVEGYSNTKTDGNGITYNLNDGDTIFYYVDKKASDDYKNGGTH